MIPGTQPLASGNLASSRRTITGVLGQLALAGLDDAQRLAVVRQIGLPTAAIEDPEFPISLGQELQALSLMLSQLEQTQRSVAGFAIETFSRIGINHYGVLGLAMQHAPTTLEALAFFLHHPELSWGHSRIVIRSEASTLRLDFDMDVPAVHAHQAEALRSYCIPRDLVSVYRLIADLIGATPEPAGVTLPFATPPAPFDARAWLPCPVTFDAPTATLDYPLELANSAPIHASRGVFKRYATLTRQFSRVLADDASLTEQVTRLLWAYTPPPNREEVATMLTMSARTLARKLETEGTSFNSLLRKVHQERACNFLRHTKLPVSVIAERMGYSEPAAFTRAFQSWTGLPPTRWRATQRSRP
ncbi:MAG: AraC family transcriptional regulator ligand-binding domain-containing protein [Gammaproteobacteria bacterium]|nr:AraC family transcriptional regulator ligand-binding domain-containing protein [Gammaproteobacteria bacterium]